MPSWSLKSLWKEKKDNNEVEQLELRTIEDETINDITKHLTTAVNDPFVKAPPKVFLTTDVWLQACFPPAITLTMILLCVLLDRHVPGMETIFQPYDVIIQMWIPEIDPNDSKKIFTAIILGMSVMFSIVLSVIGTVLDMSSSKFTKANVSAVFYRDKAVIGMVVLVVFGTVVSFYIFMTFSDPFKFAPRFGAIFAVVCILLQLLGIIPFINYLFVFLDPQLVITKINDIGMQGVRDAFQDPDGDHVGDHQKKAIQSIEHLRDAAYRSIRKRDKNIASKACDGLCSFALNYAKYKSQMFKHWHYVPPWMKSSPDFVTIIEELQNNIVADETWLEWKLFRQYLELYNAAIPRMEEICYHVALNTRIIGQVSGGQRGDLPVLDMAIKFFNTYLRSGMNKNSAHAVYIVLFQYKSLGEFCTEYSILLRKHFPNEKEKERLAASLEERALRIAKYMRYYSYECLLKKLVFIVEVISQDVRAMCELAYRVKSPIHDQLLDVFLSIYDQSELGPDSVIKGVRRAKICLATAYLASNDTYFARKVFEDFQDEPREKIAEIVSELQHLTTHEWYEVSERGVNIMWVSEEQKQQLPVFYSWFKNSNQPKRYLTPAEIRKLEIEQKSRSPTTKMKSHDID